MSLMTFLAVVLTAIVAYKLGFRQGVRRAAEMFEWAVALAQSEDEPESDWAAVQRQKAREGRQ